MMTIRPFCRICLAALCALILTGFEEIPPTTVESTVFQPLDERAAQDSLPKSDHALWAVLAKSEVNFSEENGFTAKIAPEVKALDGKDVSISGFMLPLEEGETFTHYLLSLRTPTCFYCPPGTPTEVIEVFMAKPMAFDENLITVKGRFALTSNKDMGIFYVLKDAHPAK
jgi:hypothetical protein